MAARCINCANMWTLTDGNYAVAWSPDGKSIVALNKTGNDANGLRSRLLRLILSLAPKERSQQALA